VSTDPGALEARPLFAVWGNCQAEVIARVIQESPGFKARYQHAKLPPCYLATSGEVQGWLQAHAPKVGLLISQKLKTGWRGEAVFDTSTLHQASAPGSRLLRWSDTYYRGYAPMMAYPVAFPRVSALSDYVNIVAELAWLHDRREDMLRLYSDPGVIPQETVLSIHETALRDLAAREDDCDLKAAPYLAQQWRSGRQFESFNHPRRPLVVNLVNQALDHLGIEDRAPEKGRPTFSRGFGLPAFAAFDAILDAPEHSDGPGPFIMKGQKISAEQYFSEWFQAFDRLGRDKIEADLAAHERNQISNMLLSAVARAWNIPL